MSTTTAEKLAELHEKLELSKAPGNPRAIQKRKDKGLPTPRERIEMLLDPGTFVEMGQLARQPGDDSNPYGDGVVTGHGLVDGRPVAVFAHDQTVFGGAAGEIFGRKVAAVNDFAIKIGCRSSVSTSPPAPASRTR